MNITPVNYQSMSVSQNLSPKNPTVNFKGYISEETLDYIGKIAMEFSEGDINKANRYNQYIVNAINNALKKYHPDLVLRRMSCVKQGKERDYLSLAHKQYPKESGITVSDCFTMDKSPRYLHIANFTLSDPKRLQLDIIAKFRNAISKGNYSRQQVNEMNEAINQLSIHAHGMYFSK